MRQRPCTPRRNARGFTLTEMIVVVGITVLIIGILFPALSAMTGSSRVEAGLNTVGMSADVARQWVRPLAWEADANDAVTHEQYNGTAALFCPTGEVRIVYNDRYANDGSGYLEDAASTPSPLATNGYKDNENTEYIRLPDNVGVAGIVRTNSGATDVRFIAPPFALAFNENGNLNFGDTTGLIYYNADGTGGYDTGADRASVSGYDPRAWNGQGSATNATPNTTTQVRDLPFEAIECVIGVMVYDDSDFRSAFAGSGMYSGGFVDLTSAAGQWLQDNGRPLFFSPQSGIALRDEDGD